MVLFFLTSRKNAAGPKGQASDASHGAQRGFFVAVAKDSPEVTLVIESVLRLLFEFQVMSGARAQCAEFSVHILHAASC